MSIARERLSADVHQELLGRIIRGELAPGRRLKDAELAESLGVSRTPVREALLRLEREGFITSQQHFGFSVKRLLESEIREVYPLVRLLECSALESSPLPDAAKLGHLRELGLSLPEKAADPLKLIELDSSWHRTLVEDAGNAHLLRILAELKRLVLRYEYAFMEDTELVSESQGEHAAIIEALERKDRRKAVKLLGEHWDRCTKATLSDFLANGVGDGSGEKLANRGAGD